MTDLPIDTIQHTDALTLLRCLPTESIDLIVASPPYDKMRKYKGYTFPFEDIAHESYRVLKDGGVQVWIVGDSTSDGDESLTSMRQTLYFHDIVGFKVNDTMIYHRQSRFPEVYRYWQDFEYMIVLTKGKPKTFNPQKEPAKNAGKKVSTERQVDGSLKRPKTIRQTTDEKSLSNVWYISRGDMERDDKIAYRHPAKFPEIIAERHILTWSNPGDVVLDYFMGSGTTAKMARNHKRHFIGCDISLDYVLISHDRLRLPFAPRHTPANDDVSGLPLFAMSEANS